MIKLNQRAFSHIELIIVVIVIGLVSGIGYTVWQRSSNTNPDSQAAAGYPVDPINFPNGITYSVRDDRAAGKPGQNNTFYKTSKYKYKPMVKAGPIDMKACRTSNNPAKPVKVRAFWNNTGELQTEFKKYLAAAKKSGWFWIKTNGQYQLVKDVPRSREVQPPKKVTDNPGTWKFILEKSYRSVVVNAHLVFVKPLPNTYALTGYPNASRKVFWDGGGYSESDIYSHRTGEFSGLIRTLEEHPQYKNNQQRDQIRETYRRWAGVTVKPISTKNPLAWFEIQYEDIRNPQTIRWVHHTDKDGKVTNVQVPNEPNIKKKYKLIKFLSIPKC